MVGRLQQRRFAGIAFRTDKIRKTGPNGTLHCTFDSTADIDKFSTNSCGTSAFLLPIMESMGVKYCPEVSSGVVVRDLVVDLTEVAPYWNFIFHRVRPSQLSHLVDFGVLPRPAFYLAGFC